jgi:hypothetical protein
MRKRQGTAALQNLAEFGGALSVRFAKSVYAQQEDDGPAHWTEISGISLLFLDRIYGICKRRFALRTGRAPLRSKAA